MNEAKPIVTYHGNTALFSSLHKIVSQGLPKEPWEWRRSYGRAPRYVHLDASFVPYDSDILPDDDEKTLVSRPYFHIFWTDCDLEAYKQTVKDEISEWLAALKAKNIPDWLIVVVTSDESKMKAKLLPRSSVIDKVKNEFCSKFSERCILLTDPLKLDSKSSESLSQLFDRLRSLLLQAYNRILNKYEESMRTRREKRNEPGWNYFTYFIFQEELAFMLEILGLKEDALIQYDELDAMFDQFIENHANGKMVKWLTPLLEPCTSWGGLSLAKSLDLDLREEVKLYNASLLDFRNYLFSRQAALLFQMKRAWEVAQRAMTFVYQTMAEMKALEIEIPQGAMACWVFLNSLEVLSSKEVTGKMDEKSALHTANLWDFAHMKLQELGNLCNLMPGMEPSSEQLSLVVDLVSGMGVREESFEDLAEPQPMTKLRESLSSPGSFKKHYLEICEQAMGTYKYIGRFRSSRIIGKEIAEFYMKIEPEKAENYLVDAIKMYQKEGWHHLADGTIRDLAKCQKLLAVPNKYVKTACHIACSLHLPSEDKEKYFEETEKTLEHVSENLEMRASQAIFIDHISLDQSSICVDKTLNLTLGLTSNFPKAVTFSSIQMSISSCSESAKKVYQHQQQQKNSAASQSQKPGTHQRKPSLHYVPFNNMANFQPSKRELPSTIQCRATVERQKGRIASCGIVCDRAHDLLKRTDSSPLEGNSNIERGDYSLCFSNSDVILNPGPNTLSFSLQISKKGIYKLDQLCCSWKSLHLLKPMDARDLMFEVISLSPQVALKPSNANEFITEVKQEATLTFTSGSCSIEEGTVLDISTSPPFSLCNRNGSRELTLPNMVPLTSCEIPVTVCLNRNPDTPQTKLTKAKMKVKVLEHVIEQEVGFLLPFTVTHKVYTMDKLKFVQVTVAGNTSRFILSSAKLLAAECPDVELILKNNPTLTYPVSKHQTVSFLWQLNCNIPMPPVLDLTFSCSFSNPTEDNKQSQDFSCSFPIQDFETQYHLSYEVSSMEENKSCITGESAVLDIKVRQLDGAMLMEGSKLAYTVKANGTIWAIGGKSSGVFTMKEGKHHIVLDVVPMQPGFLHFPLVTLHKYSDHLEEIAKIDIDDGDGSEDDSAPLKPPPKTWSKERSESQLSLSSMSAGQLSTRLTEFAPGQVYNESRSRQIHVYPCKTTPDIEISLVR